MKMIIQQRLEPSWYFCWLKTLAPWGLQQRASLQRFHLQPDCEMSVPRRSQSWLAPRGQWTGGRPGDGVFLRSRAVCVAAAWVPCKPAWRGSATGRADRASWWPPSPWSSGRGPSWKVSGESLRKQNQRKPNGEAFGTVHCSTFTEGNSTSDKTKS